MTDELRSIEHPIQSAVCRTADRIAELNGYFNANICCGGLFTCSSSKQCRASTRPNDFYEGQFHHVGRCFDLARRGNPLRVVVVGQEYGSAHTLVNIAARSAMIVNESGLKYRFKAESGRTARNPHMKGCTSLLRLIFQLGLGEHHDDEFLEIDGARVHIFDCFALVNFLICSAVPPMNGNSLLSQRIGGRQGRSTPTMRQNCSRHFQRVLEILEPTLVVAQGHGVRRWIGAAYGLPLWSSRNRIERLTIAGNAAELVTFSHPSARDSLNWGANYETRYLRDVVKPTIESIYPSE